MPAIPVIPYDPDQALDDEMQKQVGELGKEVILKGAKDSSGKTLFQNLLESTKDTSQKGDDAAKTVELKSAKPGPAQSPEARKKIRANVTKTRKAAEASGESGTIFDATDEALDANYAAMDKYKEAQKYVKR